MSKFCAMDDWEAVDLASEAACVMGAVGVAAPMAICFSIFMAGEASNQASPEEKPGAQAAAPRKKSSGPQDIMNFLQPPKPSWASH